MSRTRGECETGWEYSVVLDRKAMDDPELSRTPYDLQGYGSGHVGRTSYASVPFRVRCRRRGGVLAAREKG